MFCLRFLVIFLTISARPTISTSTGAIFSIFEEFVERRLIGLKIVLRSFISPQNVIEKKNKNRT